jgi:hypothetical protein
LRGAGIPKLVCGLRGRRRGMPLVGDGRLALNKADAAKALSMSIDSLERHVIPQVRVIRRGKLVLIPVGELRRWVEENAEGLVG